MSSCCYKIPCVKLIESGEWRLNPKPIPLYSDGWSDDLINHIKTNGYYFLYGKMYSYNDEIKISPEKSSHYPYNEIMSFIINLEHKNSDRFNKLVFDYLIKFSSSSIRNLKLKEIGV